MTNIYPSLFPSPYVIPLSHSVLSPDLRAATAAPNPSPRVLLALLFFLCTILFAAPSGATIVLQETVERPRRRPAQKKNLIHCPFFRNATVHGHGGGKEVRDPCTPGRQR